jgi:hypothetical protein
MSDMDGLERTLKNVAYIQAQVAAATIEVEAMKATNRVRWQQNQALAYTEEDFIKLIDKYGLGHNQVIENLYRDR